ncbi:hypothetical protein V500_06420 [Pseudogymnoascus sp. VKM F-4518 (FW-2643)]|nr:hypothetical protein V500_06420 [Pseudogymnoascus sp. VKM F-4518 (FW-2643)]
MPLFGAIRAAIGAYLAILLSWAPLTPTRRRISMEAKASLQFASVPDNGFRICIRRPKWNDFDTIIAGQREGTRSYISKTTVTTHKLKKEHGWVTVTWCHPNQGGEQADTRCRVVPDEKILGLHIVLGRNCRKEVARAATDEEEVTEDTRVYNSDSFVDGGLTGASQALPPPSVGQTRNTIPPPAQQREKAYGILEDLSWQIVMETTASMNMSSAMEMVKKASQRSRSILELDPVEAPRGGQRMHGGRLSVGKADDIQSHNEVNAQVRQETQHSSSASPGTRRRNDAVESAGKWGTTRELVK